MFLNSGMPKPLGDRKQNSRFGDLVQILLNFECEVLLAMVQNESSLNTLLKEMNSVVVVLGVYAQPCWVGRRCES